MSRYIEFQSSDGNSVLVEVDEPEASVVSGVVKVGLKDKAEEAGSAAVAIAKTTFQQAIDQILRPNAEAFISSIRKLTVAPSEVEVTFSLKITGEAGNVAICKAGGEANFSVKLTWKHPEPSG